MLTARSITKCGEKIEGTGAIRPSARHEGVSGGRTVRELRVRKLEAKPSGSQLVQVWRNHVRGTITSQLGPHVVSNQVQDVWPLWLFHMPIFGCLPCCFSPCRLHRRHQQGSHDHNNQSRCHPRPRRHHQAASSNRNPNTHTPKPALVGDLQRCQWIFQNQRFQ